MEKTVLIVDDSAVMRALIRRSLQMTGLAIRAMEACNGMKALTLIAQEKVDLVLADLHMPEMSGEHLIHYLRRNEQFSSIPVAVISAEPKLERIEDLCKLGVRGYLRKPFTPEALKQLIVPLLENIHVHL